MFFGYECNRILLKSNKLICLMALLMDWLCDLEIACINIRGRAYVFY